MQSVDDVVIVPRLSTVTSGDVKGGYDSLPSAVFCQLQCDINDAVNTDSRNTCGGNTGGKDAGGFQPIALL